MKYLFTFLSVLLTFSLIIGPAAAYEADTDLTSNSESEIADEEYENTASEATDTVEPGIFELMYREIEKHTGEIFCALSLLGTLILTFLYKTGLLPMLKASITALSGTVSGIKEKNEEYSRELMLGKDALLSGLEKADEALAAISERINAFELDAKRADNLEKRDTAIMLILKTQIDALSDVFMSSSLPEYQKAALGERITSMKEALRNVAQEREN